MNREDDSNATTAFLVRRLGPARDVELGPRAARSARATTAHRRSAKARTRAGTGGSVGLPGRASTTRRLVARTSDRVVVRRRRRAVGGAGARARTNQRLTLILSRRLRPLVIIVLLRDHGGGLLQSSAPSLHRRRASIDQSCLRLIARRREPISELVRRRGSVRKRVVVDAQQSEWLAPSGVVGVVAGLGAKGA
jgi:hypothetical protein